MKLKSFDDLFNILITDCALIENQKLNVLQTMIIKCQSNELKTALQQHQTESKHHTKKIHQLIKESGIKIEKAEWESPMKGVFQSIVNFLNENDSSPLLDAAIITMLQQIEHLEIAHYGTLKEYATITEKNDIRDLLKETLQEEKKTDSLLIRLARDTGINLEAKKARI